MTHSLTLRRIERATRDTRHLVFERPADLGWTPGQAFELSLDKDGWRDEGRPFTPVSLPQDPDLEFVIKIYPDHDGVTEQIDGMAPGDKVTIDGPFGDMQDAGPGLYIAGGAGVTPIIALLRKRLEVQGDLRGSTLIFSNKTPRDIIWRDTLAAMPGLNTVFVASDEAGGTIPVQPLDQAYLQPFVTPQPRVYLCGPPPMMEAVQGALTALGVSDDALIADDWS